MPARQQAVHALTLLVAVACARPQPELRIDGSPGVAPLVRALAAEYVAASDHAPVTFGAGLGASARIRALTDGRIDLAMASHGVDSAALQQQGIAVYEIARTAVVFAANGVREIPGLDATTVCDLFHGRRRPTVALMRPAGEVDADVAIAVIPCLANVVQRPGVRIIERPDSMAAALTGQSGVIGLTSMPFVLADSALTALNFHGIEPTPENVASGRYPLVRHAYLLWRLPTPPHVQSFLTFIRSGAGERVLRESGAVPTR